MIKPNRRTTQTEYVDNMKEVRHTHAILVGKLERKSHLGDLGIDGRIS
jgi:hypothetical protein